MESSLSLLSSLKDDGPPPLVPPHHREAYRLAIYALLWGGQEAYREFLRAEQVHGFLSEEEIRFICQNARPLVLDDSGGERAPEEEKVCSSTYFPALSDEEVPDLTLGWTDVRQGKDTSISLLYHPPRRDTPTIKEVVRSQIQAAREVIAIAMDVFTDIDIFKDVLQAALCGVAVYILLDDARVGGFLQMSNDAGVSLPHIRNICVRTVRGPEYQCQSGMRFHGGLQEKFMLVDGRTVLYGSYSYSWSFEKINLSMVLVITGQLVASFDEEFRRVFARSLPPAALTLATFPVPRRGRAGLQTTSLLSLNRMPSRGVTRGPQNGGLHDAGVLTRGLSVQERLHRSHYPSADDLLRGHSYGAELQRTSSATRLRMGTKDLGVPPDGPPQQHRHNPMPFHSESSLHRPDTGPSGAPVAPMAPHGGLNEFQAQWVHQRYREILSKMEAVRQKRRSLQDNFRQSQESLRSVRSAMASSKGPDPRCSGPSSGPNPQTADPRTDADGYHAPSRDDLNPAADPQLHPPAPAKADQLRPYGGVSVQHSRGKKSLFEIPEEKEGPSSHPNGQDRGAPRKNEESEGAETLPPQVTVPADPDRDRARPDSGQRPEEGQKSSRSFTDEGRTEDQGERPAKTKAHLQLEMEDGALRGTENCLNPGLGADKTPVKEHSPPPLGSQPPLSLPSKLEKPRSPFSKRSLPRSSKRKPHLAAEPDPDRRSSLDGEGQSKRERGPGPHRGPLGSRTSCPDRAAGRPEKAKSSSLGRQDAGLTQSDNRLGRFMQRVGHLINKHK